MRPNFEKLILAVFRDKHTDFNKGHTVEISADTDRCLLSDACLACLWIAFFKAKALKVQFIIHIS